MVRGKFLCFTLLAIVLVFPIEQAVAQAAGPAVQNEAGRPIVTSGAFGDSAAKEAPAPAEPGASAALGAAAEQMRISGGDLLNISVYGVPELAEEIRVNNSGDVYLPLIGYVQLGGLTLDQAQTVIENRLREGGFVKNPHVTVFLKDFVNQSATVTGEVNHPGIYPIVGTRRLLEVLAARGKDDHYHPS